MREKWIDWHGGHCPVSSDSLVNVKFRDQIDGFEERHGADRLRWDHRGSGGDILAYRVVETEDTLH